MDINKDNNPRPPLDEPYRDWAIRDASQAGYGINSEEAFPQCYTFIRKGPRPGPSLDGPAPRLFPGRQIVLVWVAICLVAIAMVAFFLG